MEREGRSGMVEWESECEGWNGRVRGGMQQEGERRWSGSAVCDPYNWTQQGIRLQLTCAVHLLLCVGGLVFEEGMQLCIEANNAANIIYSQEFLRKYTLTCC